LLANPLPSLEEEDFVCNNHTYRIVTVSFTYVPELLNSSLSFGLLPRYEPVSTLNEIHVLSYDSMTILISFNKDVVRPENQEYISR
jgi:hypothetical protein